jgi:hypothetical protein
MLEVSSQPSTRTAEAEIRERTANRESGVKQGVRIRRSWAWLKGTSEAVPCDDLGVPELWPSGEDEERVTVDPWWDLRGGGPLRKARGTACLRNFVPRSPEVIRSVVLLRRSSPDAPTAMTCYFGMISGLYSSI